MTEPVKTSAVSWLVKSGEGEALPHYYTNKGYSGGGLTFTPTLRDAYRFDSAEQAEAFVGRRMQHLQVQVVPAPKGELA